MRLRAAADAAAAVRRSCCTRTAQARPCARAGRSTTVAAIIALNAHSRVHCGRVGAWTLRCVLIGPAVASMAGWITFRPTKELYYSVKNLY